MGILNSFYSFCVLSGALLNAIAAGHDLASRALACGDRHINGASCSAGMDLISSSSLTEHDLASHVLHATTTEFL